MKTNMNMTGWDYPFRDLENDSIEDLKLCLSGRGHQEKLKDLSHDMAGSLSTHDGVLIPSCRLRFLMSESEMDLRFLAAEDLIPCGCLEYSIDGEKISGKFQIQLFPGMSKKFYERFSEVAKHRFHGALVSEYFPVPSDPGIEVSPSGPWTGGMKRYVIWYASDLALTRCVTSYPFCDPTVSETCLYSFEGECRPSQDIHIEDLSSFYHEFKKVCPDVSE